MQHFIGTKPIIAKPMNRLEYNVYRDWPLPENENGADEGYLVECLDGGKPNDARHQGYISWSPKEQFEAAYQVNGKLSFGHALHMLKAGARVSRSGWNGKGMWLTLVKHWQAPMVKADDGTLVSFNTLPFIAMRVVTGELVPWLASQTDMLADDWEVLS